MPLKNAWLTPLGGTGRPAIAPQGGTDTLPTVPPGGPIKDVFRSRSVPPAGHHLEMPSIAIESEHGTYRRLTAQRDRLFSGSLTSSRAATP
jgi:hypothetical protein